MKKHLDKLLVIITSSIFIVVAICVFWIDISCPKKINAENGLIFGNEIAKIKLVVFEDFKCKYCKLFSKEILPQIKNQYIDTNIINYTIVPLAFINGSDAIANAAVGIYEMNKDDFFEFLQIISDENKKIENKEELLNEIQNLKNINFKILKEFVNQDVFEGYLQNNLEFAKTIMKTFKVPTFYLNGNEIHMDQIINKIQELISYEDNNEIISK